MGYTHYFYRKPELDPEKYKKLVEDIKKIIAAGGVTIKNGMGEGEPIINTEGIIFNGDADQGHDHETLSLERVVSASDTRAGMVFEFCKTAHKPYDKVVTATLIAAKFHFGNDIKLSSDGTTSEWADGKKLFEKATGQKAPVRFLGKD